MTVGCARPDLSEIEDNEAPVFVEPKLGIEIVNAQFWTNGTLRSDRINLESEDFKMLFVYLRSSGLYIVTVEPTESSVQNAFFTANEVHISGGRTDILFRSTSTHVFSDGLDRDAWVEFIPGIRLEGVPGAVYGLATERSHIPGL
jgi:hypothetical protein